MFIKLIFCQTIVILSKHFNQMKEKSKEIEFSKIPLEFLNYPKSENESFNSYSNNSIDSNKILNQTDIAKPKVSIKAIAKEKPGKFLFKKSAKEGILKASDLKLDGVQIYATSGEFSPEVLTEKDIAEYNALLKEKGLSISALCGDMGGHGFEIAQDNPERVVKTKAIIDLAEKFQLILVEVLARLLHHPNVAEELRSQVAVTHHGLLNHAQVGIYKFDNLVLRADVFGRYLVQLVG